MDTFAKFFSGTTGVILAIGLCLAVICASCVLFFFVAPIVIPVGTPIP